MHSVSLCAKQVPLGDEGEFEPATFLERGVNHKLSLPPLPRRGSDLSSTTLTSAPPTQHRSLLVKDLPIKPSCVKPPEYAALRRPSHLDVQQGMSLMRRDWACAATSSLRTRTFPVSVYLHILKCQLNLVVFTTLTESTDARYLTTDAQRILDG